MKAKELEEKVAKLEEQVLFLARELKDVRTVALDGRDEARFVRRRLGAYYPEPTHCPSCKARLHPQADVCQQCGSRRDRDPGRG